MPQSRARGSQLQEACLLALLLLPSVLLFDASATVIGPIQITHGQQLADAVASWGQNGQHVILQLATNYISVRNATFTAVTALPGGPQPFTTGMLTIQGMGIENKTVLDAGMRSGLVPKLSGIARINLQDITLINLCEEFVPDQGPTSLRVELLQRAEEYQSHSQVGVTLYGRQADVAMQLYIFLTQESRFPAVRDLTAFLHEDLPYGHTIFSAVTPYAVGIQSLSQPSVLVRNEMLQSWGDPTDAVGHHLQAQGLKMPYQYCNGTMMDPTYAEQPVDSMRGPIWVSDGSKTFLDALEQAVDSTEAGGAWDPDFDGSHSLPPVVYVVANHSLATAPGGAMLPAVSTSDAINISFPLIIAGLYSDDYIDQISITLDLAGMSGLMALQDGAQIFLQHITLRGLATLPLPPLSAADQLGPTISSALGLHIVMPPVGADLVNNPTVWLHNVTLHLPIEDYLALAELATTDTQYKLTAGPTPTTSSLAKQLQNGITDVSLQRIPNDCSYVMLQSYTGWGVNATLLRLLPEEPTQLDCVVGKSGLLSKVNSVLGLVVGLGVGAVVSIMCVLGLWWRSLHKQYNAATRGKGTGKGGSGMASPAASVSPEPGSTASACSSNASSSRARSQPTPRSEVSCLPRHSSLCFGSSGTSHQSHALLLEPQAPRSQFFHNVRQAQEATMDFMEQVTSNPDEAVCDNQSQQQQPNEATSQQQQQQQPRRIRILGSISLRPSRFQGRWLGKRSEDKRALASRGGGDHTSQGGGGSNPHIGCLPDSWTTVSRLSTGMLPSRLSQESVSEANGCNRVSARRTEVEMVTAADPAQENMTAQPQATPDGDQDGHVVLSVGAPPPPPQHTHSGRLSAVMSGDMLMPDQLVKQLAAGLNNTANKVVLVGLLGQGSWGIVYKGIWRGLPVALKTMVFDGLELSAHSNTNRSRHPKAIMEAAIAVSVGHRNVVATYHYDIKPVCAHNDQHDQQGGLQIDVAITEPEPDLEQQGATQQHPAGSRGRTHTADGVHAYKLYLVQELCGTALSAALQSHMLHSLEGVPEEVDVIHLLLDVAKGLEYLHSKGIIHGDLKPGNVLLSVDAQSPVGVVAKLTDFGLSTYIEAGSTHVSNFNNGTPFYVAPEVVNLFRALPASDMYSFGVLMWQVYTGQAPYMPSGCGSFRWNPAFPSFNSPYMPSQEFIMICQRCLQGDPHARPTASQVVASLQQLADRELQGAQPQPPPFAEMPPPPPPPPQHTYAAIPVNSSSPLQVQASQQPAGVMAGTMTAAPQLAVELIPIVVHSPTDPVPHAPA